MPVAAEATIPLESPAPSPATKKFGTFVSRFLFTKNILIKNSIQTRVVEHYLYTILNKFLLNII
ncbi:MAG: hypothetical protein KAW45_04070 [Thermoplasmatales archaeon]|nr:hypothetical protein [Thermoplasmatales archaeon]